jgi:hypothetical protein
LVKLLGDIEMFKRNKDRARYLKEEMEHQVQYFSVKKDLLKRAEDANLKKVRIQSDKTNHKFGFNIILFKYFEDIQ